MFTPTYFPPTYFSPTYFPPGAAPPATPPPRDRQILKLIAAAIEATGQFSAVTTSGDPEAGRLDAGYGAVAALSLSGRGREADVLGSDSAAVPLLRTANFTLTIAARDEDPDARQDELDRLQAVAANAVTGQSFGGTLPTMTRLGSEWEWAPPQGPEERVRVAGAFAYIVASWAGRSEDA